MKCRKHKHCKSPASSIGTKWFDDDDDGDDDNVDGIDCDDDEDDDDWMRRSIVTFSQVFLSYRS